MSDATIQLADPHGIWRPVYARRQALHTTADTVVLAAWKADLAGIDLGPAITAWRQAVDEAVDPARQHRREAAAAALLALLTPRPWRRVRAALALAAQQAHRAGWAAGHALVTRDTGDDTDYDDQPLAGLTIGSPDMPDHAAEGAATATLNAALRATAKRAGRAADDSQDDPEQDTADVIDAGDDLLLATDTAVSAAYGAGLIAAYLAAGRQSVDLTTAGDGRVCQACISAEASGPYSLFAAPSLPLHPRCRCVLAST